MDHGWRWVSGEGTVKHVRRATIAVLGGVLLLGCTRPHPPKPDPAKGKTPVIFVHGYAESGAMWDAAVAAFTAAGYQATDLTRFDYPSQGEGALDATQAAEKLAATVDTVRQASKHDRVDIVAHSLGNLVTKTCIVEGGCRNKVTHWANFAGAQNGTGLAADPTLCPDPACTDMAPGSALITRLQAADDAQIARQRVKVQVHWSPNDGIIIPPEGSKEAYAENIEVAGTIDHFTISNDPGVLADTLAFVGGRAPGPPQHPDH
jgi:triacylglycerol lipase